MDMGRDGDAIASLEMSINSDHIRPITCAKLSMTYHRYGKSKSIKSERAASYEDTAVYFDKVLNSLGEGDLGGTTI